MSSFLRRCLTGIILGLIFFVGLYLPPVYVSIALSAILILILITEWPRIASRSVSIFWLTPVYPIVPFILLIALNQSELYRPLFIVAVVLSAAHDMGSYFVGNLIGQHRIAPSISPGKTWEGFFGGLALTFLVNVWITHYFNSPISWIMLFVLTCAICILAFFGDLFESWLKRKARIKDSGIILPGHGGFLDRFDSIIIVASFFYVLRDVLLKFYFL